MWAQSSPLALPTTPPTLTRGWWLYQMNFQVPAGLPAGDITLVVTQNGQPSNQTVLPYQP
jgi:uncharacterized protein (TIGR03437 family)